MSWFTIILSIIALMVVVSLGALILIRGYGKKYILEVNNLPKECDTIIILGAGIRKDGKPCDLLADRLEIGAKAYIATNAKTILLTGDNCDNSRREVDVMKTWIIKNHLKNKIQGEEILLDGLGVCTYDSIYRAKEIFKINTAIISTNGYHLPRAIYIARRLGIEAYGIKSDLRNYDFMDKYRKREILAQFKDFWLTNLLKVIHILNRR